MTTERTMTVWTREETIKSSVHKEAFCVGHRPFSYTDNRSPGKPISDILADGWKLLASPKKEKEFFVWWFTRSE